MAYLESISSEQAKAAIKSTNQGLKDIKPVNDDIINGTRDEINFGLKEKFIDKGKITPQEYIDMLKQNHAELEFRVSAGKLLNQQIERLEKLEADVVKEEPKGFILPDKTTREELKKLIALMHLQRTLTNDSEEKLLLTTLLQTVESCKTSLDEKRPFETKTIPLLKSEEQYVASLLEQVKNFELDAHEVAELDEPGSEAIESNPLNTEAIEIYFKKLEEFKAIQKEYLNDPGISDDEVRIMQHLYRDISVTTLTVLDDLIMGKTVVDDEKFEKEISKHIHSALEQSKEIEITSGFKGFVNSICTAIKLDPIFTITNSPIIDKMKSMKTELFALKGDNAEVDEDDEQTSLLRNS